MIQVGVLLMTFGIGAFLGFATGFQFNREPTVLVRTESHANNSEYLAKHLTGGMSKLEAACKRVR